MPSTGTSSLDLMTRVLSGLGPTATFHGPSHEVSAPGLEDTCEQPPSPPQPPSTLSDVVNTLDQQPVGWLPPLYPSLHPYLNRNSPPAPPASTSPAYCLANITTSRSGVPTTLDPLDFDPFGYESPDVSPDDADDATSASTPSSSTFTRSPSPLVSAGGSSVESVPSAEDGNDSPEHSSIPTYREKERRRIREGSGVRPKVKAPRRSAEAAPSSHPPLEMVRCKWAGCAERLHVDYVSVTHWGRHLRTHFADQKGNVIRCRWGRECGAIIHRSSMWKHIVVHQPKFKIRCPRGCDVFTRGDMMKRHLQYCHFARGLAAEEYESEGEAGVEVGEGGCSSGYESDGGGVKEGGDG